MAAYKHGVFTTESPTSLIPTVETASAVPFIVGIAPVNMVDEPSVNRPERIASFSEFVKKFGYQGPVASGDVQKFVFNLCEFAYVDFNYAGIQPIYFVNVLDPSKHKKAASTTSVTVASGTATIKETGIIKSSVKLTAGSGSDATVINAANYELAFDDDGFLVVTSNVNSGGNNLLSDATYTLTAEVIDPSAVTVEEVIGGVDATTGANTGYACINDVYALYGEVPTLAAAPGYSGQSAAASLTLAAQCLNFTSRFNAFAVVDAPANADECSDYTQVPNWKSQNSLSHENMCVCWPKCMIDDLVINMSTRYICTTGLVDHDYDDSPHASASNNSADITGICLEDGTEVVLDLDKAGYLNGQGIVTCVNHSTGWTIWGNRTAAYPGNTDPKDAFIPVKRMFYYVRNLVTLTAMQKVDKPGVKRQISILVDSLNVRLNSMVAAGQLLGGLLQFREEDNSITDMADGIFHFKLMMTPPSPMRSLEFDFEIDTSYYSAVFA